MSDWIVWHGKWVCDLHKYMLINTNLNDCSDCDSIDIFGSTEKCIILNEKKEIGLLESSKCYNIIIIMLI